MEEEEEVRRRGRRRKVKSGNVTRSDWPRAKMPSATAEARNHFSPIESESDGFVING